ncbi:MATE family efflux transporter [Teredinibacter turnerae]|uniref:MATE family efflux transporter n=1 Tax=Teredinibacter turnerae TaxID=2426 RepID=UPI0012F7C6AC|nr:MATE family efflux transporter [Teredinibacter turnerae]
MTDNIRPEKKPPAAAPAEHPASPSRHQHGANQRAREAILHGPIFKTMMLLALPTIGVLVAQTLVNVAETFYVSRLGTDALIGVALVFPIWMLMTMMSAGGIGGGVAAAVARANGANRIADANALVLHTLVLALGFGVLFSALMLAFGRPLYAQLGGEGVALDCAVTYSDFIFLAAIPIWMVNLLSAALRGAGNVKVPAQITFTGAVVLVILSPLLIFGVGPVRGFGVAGAGIAVTLYYTGAALFLLRYLASGRAGLRLSLARLRWSLFSDILKTGLLGALNTVQLNLMVLLVTAAVSTFGVDAIGGYGTASRLDYVLIPVLFGLGTAILTMVGTNVGAGNVARAKRIAWLGTALSMGFTETIGLVVAFWPVLWLGIFSDNAAVTATGALYFHIVAPVYAANGAIFALAFVAQGSGRMGWVFLAGSARLLIAAVGGWFAVTQLGFSQAGLFALVAVSLLAAAAISGTAALNGVFWPSARR